MPRSPVNAREVDGGWRRPIHRMESAAQHGLSRFHGPMPGGEAGFSCRLRPVIVLVGSSGLQFHTAKGAVDYEFLAVVGWETLLQATCGIEISDGGGEFEFLGVVIAQHLVQVLERDIRRDVLRGGSACQRHRARGWRRLLLGDGRGSVGGRRGRSGWRAQILSLALASD